MQKKNLSSDDNNAVSLDNILSEYDSKSKTSETKGKYNEAIKKLDAMFESEAEDLAWLDDIMSDSGSARSKSSAEEKSAKEEPAAEIISEEDTGEGYETETEETIVAENADSPSPYYYAAPDLDVPAEHENTQTSDEAPVYDDTYSAEEENVEAAEDTNYTFPPEDDDTKIYDPEAAQYDDTQYDDVPYSDTEIPEEAPELDLDAFEGNMADGEYVHNVESAAKQQTSNVNNSLGKLFGLADEELEDEQSNDRKRKGSTHKKIAKELGAYEEINMADPDAVGEGQRRYYLKKCRALLSLFGATFFLLIGIYSELAMTQTPLPYPSFISDNPTVFALVNLQIMCFGAMCVIDSLVHGFTSILDKKFSPASCALVVFTICTVQAITSVIMAGKGLTIGMYCSLGCFALFMLAMYDYLRASADDKAYRIASSTSNKFGAYQLGVNSLECSPFASHIDLEKAKVISVCKGSVYEGFVGRNEKAPEDEKKLGLMTAIILGIAFIAGIFMAIFPVTSPVSEKIYRGISGFTFILVSSIPFNMFFVSALPKYLATKLGKNINATLVGQNASEEYKGLSVVAFEDTEVFLPKDVRISSIKTYGGMALDEAVVTMSKIYGKIGGPLSKIFAKMVDVRNLYSDVRLVKVYPDAIEVNVDGIDVCLATASYLGANGIRIINDSVDASYEQSHGSILFMVCGGRILAKFYIKYSINPLFEKTLKELHDANLCVGIKTLDPCITNDLVFGCLEKANYALSVIKGSSANDIPVVQNRVSSGVVALGSVHNFLEMLLICERTGRNVKINNAVKFISVILCVILATFFALNANYGNIFSLIIQAFWMLPVLAISYFNK